ncbi:MAG TPA: hypothetical protein VF753_09715 [Terriglobales bacterium]
MVFVTRLLQIMGFVPTIVNGIEGLFNRNTGAQKKDAVMSFLQTALSLSDAVLAKDVVDEAKFKEGLGKVVDGTVECLNASIWAKSQAAVQK